MCDKLKQQRSEPKKVITKIGSIVKGIYLDQNLAVLMPGRLSLSHLYNDIIGLDIFLIGFLCFEKA